MFFTLDQINRAFYEPLRLHLVENGYLPDIIGKTKEQFETEKQAIYNAKKPLIQVFGVGVYKARQAVENNKIIIDRTGIFEGQISNSDAKFYTEKQDGRFVERQYPNISRNIEYQISYVTDNGAIDNLLINILLDTFGNTRTLFGVNSDHSFTENSFTFAEVGNTDNTNGKYIERFFRYMVKNVYISDAKVSQEDVAPMEKFIITRK